MYTVQLRKKKWSHRRLLAVISHGFTSSAIYKTSSRDISSRGRQLGATFSTANAVDFFGRGALSTLHTAYNKKIDYRKQFLFKK